MTEDKVPQPRRDVWLQIALAVAQDGLPEPRSLNFNPNHIVCVYLDTADEARAWADWLEAESSARWHADPADGTTSVHYYSERFGWPWQIAAYNLPTSTLAQQVAAAILLPDSTVA